MTLMYRIRLDFISRRMPRLHEKKQSSYVDDNDEMASDTVNNPMNDSN